MLLLSAVTSLCPSAFAAERLSGVTTDKQGYIAEKDTMRSFLDALSAKLTKPIIVSPLATKKRISGSFDMANPQALLERVSVKLGLVWYDDGQNIYVYDSSETKSVVITLKNISVTALKEFLVSSGLYDSRYPLRSDGTSKTFYLSGPPIYTKLVTETASLLDGKEEVVSTDTTLNVIPLHNTFVNDRTYRYRDETVVIPGIASIVRQLTGGEKLPAVGVVAHEKADNNADGGSESQINILRSRFPEAAGIPDALLSSARNEPNRSVNQPVVIAADLYNNTLLVKGSSRQVSNIRQLVAALDTPRRHIEMSVWIIDLHKDEFDQLGVSWSGSFKMGDQMGISFNGGGTSTVDGASFMTSVMALAQKNKANIVSRPMILTQENVPAVFDNNRTFYTRLIGERTSSLEHVTYGTSLSVLPRFTGKNEVELLLTVEDGNQVDKNQANESLPEVGRTNISTIARVPKGKSLLIGGYTRSENNESQSGIPGLKDIPWVGGLFRYHSSKTSEMVRVFLIQPKEITAEHAVDRATIIDGVRGKPATGELLDWANNFLDGKE